MINKTVKLNKIIKKMTIMYELKPIINHNTAIERSSCMYEMKNIHDDGDSSKHKCTIVSEVTDKFINITKVFNYLNINRFLK